MKEEEKYLGYNREDILFMMFKSKIVRNIINHTIRINIFSVKINYF